MSDSNFRVEQDFLGKKQIPKNAYYGIQTVRALENFPITGGTVNHYFIQALAIVKKSAAQANRDTGHLKRELAEPIIQAATEIIEGNMHDQFLVDPIQGGAGTSSNMNVNEVIANRALEIMGHPRGSYDIISPTTHVNMAQSTNDVFPTAGHIAILTKVEHLLRAARRLQRTYENKAEQFADLLKIGRTHLQDAVPMTLGQEFGAYAAALARDIERIEQMKEGLYAVNMGGTAVGTGLNADPQYIKQVIAYLSENSRLPLTVAENLIDATQNTDTYTALSAVLKVCMLNTSKVANDLRMLASGPKVGLGEITLPPRQAGSSIMPGKVNPVMAEVVSQVAFEVSGNDHTIGLASEAGQFQLNVMEPVLVANLINSIKIMTNVFTVFNDYCIKGIVANTEQLEANMQNSLGTITAINPHIGYEKATEVAMEAYETGESIRTICERKGLLTKEALDEILKPSEMTKPGISAYHLLEKAEKKSQKLKE